jgi:hypothetical protein
MTDIRKKHRMIAKAIVQAQIASDAGKNIQSSYGFRAHGHMYRSPEYFGYDMKADMILRAIKLIDSTKTYFRYYVVKAKDQNGYPSIIAYFQYKHPKKSIGTMQISFHTPINKAGELKDYIGKGTPMRWDKQIGGSQKAYDILAETFYL